MIIFNHTKHWAPEIRQNPVKMTRFRRVQIIKWTTLGRRFGGDEIDDPFGLTRLAKRVFYFVAAKTTT